MLEKKKLNVENTVIVGIINAQQDEEKSKEYLDELAFLALTAGGKVIQRFTQKISLPNPKTFIGSGKLEEVQAFVEANDVSTVVFDDELTPAQQNNIEKTLRCKILDRTGLILDIFAQRAQTSYARTQVELAQYQYLLPRLIISSKKCGSSFRLVTKKLASFTSLGTFSGSIEQPKSS